MARSRVDARNNAPAPSASEAVMIGVLTQKKPFSSNKRWIAFARLWRTRAPLHATATLVANAVFRLILGNRLQPRIELIKAAVPWDWKLLGGPAVD